MAMVIGGVFLVRLTQNPELRVAGLPADGVVNAETLRDGKLVVTAEEAAELKGAEVTLNGKRLPVRSDGRELVVGLAGLAVPATGDDGKSGESGESGASGKSGARAGGQGLPDGEYVLRVAKDGSFAGGGLDLTRRFTVDTTPPRLDLPDTEAPSLKGPVTIKGRAPDASSVTVAGQKAKLGKDGAFAVRLDRLPSRVTAVATDKAGNTADRDAVVTVRRPMLRAVHVSSHAWADDSLREPVLRMLKEKKINAVQLDIKDELGEVGYDSKVPLARKIKAAKGYYDAKKAIKQIHDAGGTVVGRLVAFRDPMLASASWKEGNRDRVVQVPGGGPYSGGNYGGLSFTNFANKDVRQYHIDLAEEAAELGFDDILYDYIRRPDGPLKGMSFPGLGDTTPEDSIADLVADTRPAARKHGAFLGVSVFGIAVTRPLEIAQDIGKLANECDYIAPMIYPSHWAAGEYNVDNPNAQPYPITKRSLADFVKKTKHTDAQIVPWIQDFSLGVPYGDAEVSAQIRAAADNGIKSFILWNAGVRYHPGALSSIK